MQHVEMNFELSSLNRLVVDKENELILKENFKDLCSQLNSFNPIVEFLGEECRLRFEVKDLKSSFEEVRSLKISTNIDIKKVSTYFKDPLLKEKYSDDLYVCMAQDTFIQEFHEFMRIFSVIVNLSYPGSWEIGSRDSGISFDGESWGCLGIEISGSIPFVYSNSLSGIWPTIETIPLQKTWDWIISKTNFLKKMSETSIDRALTSLTYTFEEPINLTKYENFFYIMLGLEAIYNTDNSSIMKQLEEKSIFLLGKPKEYKKQIKQMYKIRSKFVHGKLNFPANLYYSNDDKIFREFLDDNYTKNHETALGILVATLQKLILKNATEIVTKTSFELK